MADIDTEPQPLALAPQETENELDGSSSSSSEDEIVSSSSSVSSSLEVAPPPPPPPSSEAPPPPGAASSSSSSSSSSSGTPSGDSDEDSLSKGLITSEEQVKEAHRILYQQFRSGKTLSVDWRLGQLKALRKFMNENKDEIINAVMKDLGKQHPSEVIASEYNLVSNELNEYISHCKKWSKPEQVYTPVASQPASSYVYKDPKGVVLIMSPWNYPVNLAIVPLIGAIAAGNCVLLKVSRHSETVCEMFCRLLPKYLDTSCIIVEGDGGASMITKLIEFKWDHVFFTGSVSVGRIVYQAAALHLTPVTLELGGKNPCIVDDTINLTLAARRIAWGKFFNAGQTCIGVDYALVVKSVYDKLVDELKIQIKDFYGDEPKDSKSFARIISKQHTQRLGSLLADGSVAVGGVIDVDQKYVSPTVLTDVRLDSPLMQDEIFGPILPLIPVDSVDDALNFIAERPKPLALYLFSASNKTQEYVLNSTTSGTAVVNDCLLQFTNSNLPFGGVGESGLGAYHGALTFDVFTHRKAVMISTSRNAFDIPVRYPPYEGSVMGIPKSWAFNTFTKIPF